MAQVWTIRGLQTKSSAAIFATLSPSHLLEIEYIRVRIPREYNVGTWLRTKREFPKRRYSGIAMMLTRTSLPKWPVGI